MSRRARPIEVGTISHGTLRAHDLYRAFRDALRDHAPDAFDKLYRPAVGYRPTTIVHAEANAATPQSGFWESEDADEAVDMLFVALSKLAPEGLYFGTHEGDGSDFGFWPIGDDT